jgi:hypothetical protein
MIKLPQTTRRLQTLSFKNNEFGTYAQSQVQYTALADASACFARPPRPRFDQSRIGMAGRRRGTAGKRGGQRSADEPALGAESLRQSAER